MDKIAPALTGADLLHLDGQCFVGDAGVLGVALNAASLAYLRRSGAATHWLVPVEDAAVVEAAAGLPGEVFWLCSQPPVRILGALAGEVRGAWLDGDAIGFNLDGTTHRLRMAQPPHPSFAMAYLARIVTKVWLEDSSNLQPVSPLEDVQPAQLIAA
jgi:hypothetical protein